MVSDTYDLALPILEDDSLDEEEKTEKIKDVVKGNSSLEGHALEETVLSFLWRHRAATRLSNRTSTSRHAPIHSSSTSSWQHIVRSTTPSASRSPSIGRASPAPRSSFVGATPAFIRSKSFGTTSPFTSPRPSPRLAFAAPIPHSPSLSNYAFSDEQGESNDYGDYGSDTVEWLVNDTLDSRPPSSGAGSTGESGLNAAAASWVQPQTNEMSSYDILRSVMGEGKTDDEIETALESNGYDLSSAIVTLMGAAGSQQEHGLLPDNDGQILIGKSMTSGQPTATNQADQGRGNIICKYWLSSGNCLRADCRFSHDLSSHICKYWLVGNCLAGDSCIFSHDPALLMRRMNVNESALGSSPGAGSSNVLVPDADHFPALQGTPRHQYPSASPGRTFVHKRTESQGSGGFSGASRRPFEPRNTVRSGLASSYGSSGSRPSSRHRSPHPVHVSSIPAVDDAEAFPSLGAAGIRLNKKHHGKRGGHGHNHAHKENTPNSLADVVRMSPGPSPGLIHKGLAKTHSSSSLSSVPSNITAPRHIPWLETGAKADHEYLRARQEAFKHGALRNKFLQSAAQAWNRNDARAAKALSLRGQSENDLMRKAHREAARVLYDSRNKNDSGSSEIYVDLHGLHPEEAIDFLEDKLLEQQRSGRIVYAITGTGHHSKNGKDKLGKAVKVWLSEWKYAYHEFSAGGTDGLGGILGIDPDTFDKSVVDQKQNEGDKASSNMPMSSTMVNVITNEQSKEEAESRQPS